MAADIFSEMVMDEAIRDKTIQVEQKLKDQEGGLHDVGNKSNLFMQEHHQEEMGDEDDDGFGEEEEKLMRDIRERRMAEMKNVY